MGSKHHGFMVSWFHAMSRLKFCYIQVSSGPLDVVVSKYTSAINDPRRHYRAARRKRRSEAANYYPVSTDPGASESDFEFERHNNLCKCSGVGTLQKHSTWQFKAKEAVKPRTSLLFYFFLFYSYHPEVSPLIERGHQLTKRYPVKLKI